MGGARARRASPRQILATPFTDLLRHLVAGSRGCEIVVAALDDHRAVRDASLRQHGSVPLSVRARDLRVAAAPEQKYAGTRARDLRDGLELLVLTKACWCGGEHRDADARIAACDKRRDRATEGEPDDAHGLRDIRMRLQETDRPARVGETAR